MNSVSKMFKNERKMLWSVNYINSLILIITLVLTGVNGRAPQKIKGGSDSVTTDYPFMVGVKYGTRFCGGVLISEKHVLTAAQCVTNSITDRTPVPLKSIQVILSQNNMENPDPAKVYSVSHRNIHARWLQQQNYSNLEADLVILRLDITKKAPSVQNGDIPDLTTTSATAGSEGLILGWGSTEVNGTLSSNLQEATTKIIDSEYCRIYNYPELANHSFCTQADNNDITICNGDIGGPFINDWGKLAGIISHTTGCVDRATNVFTDLYQYKSWIEQILHIESVLNPNSFTLPDKLENLYQKS